MTDNEYQNYAEVAAAQFSALLSMTQGLSLRFNGYARGPNIFIETADVTTTKWAAINNPYNQLGRGYAPIRRSLYGKDPSYKICNFVIPDEVAHPEPHPFLRPVDAWLQVNPAVIEELTKTNELWVGKRTYTGPLEGPNVDDLGEYQKDYEWMQDPFFKQCHPHLAKN